MAQVTALGKGALKAAADSAGSAISNEIRVQASVFASASPSAGAAATALSNGAAVLLGDAMGKAAAQKALEGMVDEVWGSRMQPWPPFQPYMEELWLMCHPENVVDVASIKGISLIPCSHSYAGSRREYRGPL